MPCRAYVWRETQKTGELRGGQDNVLSHYHGKTACIFTFRWSAISSFQQMPRDWGLVAPCLKARKKRVPRLASWLWCYASLSICIPLFTAVSSTTASVRSAMPIICSHVVLDHGLQAMIHAMAVVHDLSGWRIISSWAGNHSLVDSCHSWSTSHVDSLPLLLEVTESAEGNSECALQMTVQGMCECTWQPGRNKCLRGWWSSSLLSYHRIWPTQNRLGFISWPSRYQPSQQLCKHCSVPHWMSFCCSEAA